MSRKVKALIFGIPICCLLVAIAVPYFVEPRVYESKNSCVNLLRQIEGAKDYWQAEQHKSTNDTPTWEDLRAYLRKVPLVCPNGGTYTIGRIGELPTCSIAKDTEYWTTNHPGL